MKSNMSDIIITTSKIAARRTRDRDGTCDKQLGFALF